MTDITLQDDRVLVQDGDLVHDIPLAYQIHSRLIQTGELARLLAEHLRMEGGERLPASGAPVRLSLPSRWGLVRLHLPISGLQDLQQPMHHLMWELDLHAPDQAEQYLFDYQEVQSVDELNGAAGLRLIAVRHNLVQFCRTFCEELGWKLVALRAEGEEAADFHLDLVRAAALRDALASESYPPVRSWRRAVLAAALICFLGTALWYLTQRQPSLSTPAAETRRPQPQAAESLKAAVKAPLADAAHSPGDSATAAAPASPSLAGADTAWATLLAPLATREAELPDFFVMDGTGILVRQEEGGRGRLTSLIKRAAKVGRVSPGFYWVDFNQDLPGGLLEEDCTRPVQRMKLANLKDLAAQLKRPPSRVLVQRRRAGQGGTWNFDQAARPASDGWQVTIVPGKPARPKGSR